MKKGQLMSQPIIYLFYALVAAMILIFGIKVIVGIKDNSERVEFESFFNDLKSEVNKVYQDSYGSRLSLDKLTVPKKIDEICFVGEKELDKVRDEDLRELIRLDNDGNNVFFAGIKLDWGPRRKIDLLDIDGTICEDTRDRKINLVLENVGMKVEVKLS